MVDKDNIIKCPNCGEEINVSEVVYHQLEDQIKEDYNKKSAERDKELQKQLQEIQVEKDQIKKQKESMEEIVAIEVQSKLKGETSKLEKSIRDQLQDETSEQLATLRKELDQKSIQVKELNKTKVEIEKLKREKDELRDQVTLEKEKEFSEKLDVERDKIKKRAIDDSSLKIKELEKKLEDQTKLAEEMKRKAEQGSMQMQGEVLEIALEDLLRKEFPFDIIEEVPKGVRGADVIQTVVNSLQQNCGKMIYESKRTQAFSETWIEKLKDDQRSQQADIAIIITETLPKDIEKFGRKDGVWICSFVEAKSLLFVLREMVIKTHSVKASEENKGDKMSLLYNYLIGDDFRHRIEAIVEGFSSLKDELEKEKRAMQKIWKGREKQIEKVTSNTIDMYGSIKGIAGSAIGTVKALELPEHDDSEKL